MKKVVLSMFSCLLFGLLQAQVTVTAVPPGPRFTLDDLWQVTLVENMTPTKEVWLSVSLNVYEQAGPKILTTTSQKFQFGKAAIININKTNLDNYGPISTVYHQRSFKNELAKQGGIFPSGDYKVEVICNYEGNGFSEPLGKYLYNINAELVMPIQLVSVFNNDTIEDAYPMFNWTPPYPLPTGNLTYEIVLTEIKPLETPIAAVKRNQPLIRNQQVNQNSLIYTTVEPKLIAGKEYAWQVNAYTERGDFYSGSETWRFIYNPEEDTIDYPDQFYLMSSVIPNTYVTIFDNILPVKFVDDYEVVDTLSYLHLYDDNFALIATEEQIPIAHTLGTNYSYVRFCEDDFPIPNGRYVLEIGGVNKEKYFIRFQNNSLVGACGE